MPSIILASTSPYRQALLQRLGCSFTAVAPQCDERSLVADDVPPAQASMILARAKALSVADAHPGALIIGSDQMAADDQGVLHKPGSAEKTAEQLLRLRGRTHYLYTAMALRLPDGAVHEHLDITALTMAEFSEQTMQEVIAADQPFDCAGGYKIEGQGIRLFDAITSKDHTAITGLPLLALNAVLSELERAVSC